MSLFSSLHISSGAMGVHQKVINIVSNNIANMNTEGYHKQKADLGTLVLGIPIGNSVSAQVKTSAGVELIEVCRYETSFLGSYYRDQLANQEYLNQKANDLGDIADMFDELGGNGLDTALTGFYEALDNLNQYPSDMAARIHFLNAASTLTSSMNNIAGNLENLKNQNLGDGTTRESLENSNLYRDLNGLNSSLEDLASINRMLALSHTGSLENNNLLDRRDKVLNELAKLGNFKVEIQPNGVANVSLGGTELVSATKVVGTFKAQTAQEYDEYCTLHGIENKNQSNAVIMIEKDNGSVIQNANKKFTSGSIGAMMEGHTNIDGIDPNAGVISLSTIQGSLDTLAQTIANVFNNLQTREGAFYLDNAGGQLQLSNANLEDYVIFTANDGGTEITAANISINGLLTEEGGYNKIAAAFFENYDPLNPDPDAIDLNAVGNANNIIAMIKTQTDATGVDFEAIGNIPLADYYTGLLGKITSGASDAQNKADIQNNVVASLDEKAASQTSVDLNEELTDLVKSQTAYSASARVFTTCNTLLDTLINLGL